MSNLRSPPVEPPNFEDLTPSKILDETQEILNTTAALHDHLVETLTPTSATFANIVRPIVDDANRGAYRLNIFSWLLSQLSPSLEIRQTARKVERSIRIAQSKSYARKDVAALVSAVYAKEITSPAEDLDEQDGHLLSVIHERYVQSGTGLTSDEERERFLKASDELREICAAAQDSFIKPEEGVWFEREELDGVPEDVIATMLEDGTRVQATFRTDHARAIMSSAKKSEMRRRYTVADWQRLPDNIQLLNKAVALRDQIARILGFENHAELKMESRMAPSVAYVEEQLLGLLEKLKPIAQAEANELLELKRRDTANCGDTMDELYVWDTAYYHGKLQRQDSSVDRSRFTEYFEANHTVQAMLAIFHDLFGIDFEQSTATVWHESVTSYQVRDTSSEGGKFLGYLYVDLFERPGKHRGAQCMSIQRGFIEQNGTKHYPVSALICCYANPTHSKPTLLRHGDIITTFHELGHAVHNLVGRTKYGLPCSRDYSEIPSHMLENWTWIPDVLILIGRHYTTLNDESSTSGALPRKVAESVCTTRNVNRANSILGQVWPALFDLAIHTPITHEAAVDMDTTRIWNTQKQRAITSSCGSDPRDWGAGQARFIHMFRYNDAGYFSYPLSIAYAADIFASVFKQDPMSAVAWRRWRYDVLEAGASRAEMNILKSFLGREPSIKAILDELKA